MIVGAKPILSDEKAWELHQEYSKWVEALEKYSPTVLAKKHGISKRSVVRYGKLEHKSIRRAA